jgi:lipopolysaccharide export system protein LptC
VNARQALLLLLLAVATGWFLQKPEIDSPASTARTHGPDMFADQIEVTVMDESGQPVYHITADHLTHSPDTDRFDLTRPFIELKRAAGDNWNITSERGQMTDKGDELWFLGKVNIHRQGSKPLHIQTSDLLVKPDEEIAETENKVSISAPQYKINAIGLKADFRKDLLEFLSRVRGTVNAAG